MVGAYTIVADGVQPSGMVSCREKPVRDEDQTHVIANFRLNV